MIVMMLEQQLLSAKQVCQSCLMADKSGLPRWRGDKLGCGKAMTKSAPDQATIYRCQMGFDVTHVDHQAQTKLL